MNRESAGRGVERVLQIGDGRFLRGFVDWMLQQLHSRNLYDGRVVVAVPRPAMPGKLDRWHAHGYKYHVNIRGIDQGQLIDARDTVNVISRIFDPHAEYRQFLDLATSPDVDVVVSNTTESGITFNPEPFPTNVCPRTFPAKLTAYLWARFETFDGDPSRGMDIVPCELVEQNGRLIQALVLRHAESWNLPAEFTEWVKTSNRFYNTLVDSIVTSDPEGSGLDIMREPYYRLVIQGPDNLARKWRFQDAGLHVDWVPDIDPYRTVKVRVLNGAHTAMAALGLLLGLDTVKEVMADEALQQHIDQLLTHEVRPTLIQEGIPDHELDQFIYDTLERFQNPYLEHQLKDIQLNAMDKMRHRLLPTLTGYHRMTGTLPNRLIVSWAAQLLWHAKRASDSRHSEVGHTILKDTALWGEDLTDIPGLLDAIDDTLQRMESLGIKRVLAES
ncbi:tagaturonate reductase [Sulfobacillus harzensis]|uniref:Tagaturonate reductase n=1 Tax=Sulfobacillus harzensis TaxID=2729629 RepID=A0A7Y0Q536_9FIRM|nr:tagaturonate reductase [Sulfobacillus harzensis]NMP24676.1 tagaturonate reductase [Sulfobacillus harzensis]